MLQKELLPLLMALGSVGEVKDAGEMKKAMGENRCWDVVSCVVYSWWASQAAK